MSPKKETPRSYHGLAPFGMVAAIGSLLAMGLTLEDRSRQPIAAQGLQAPGQSGDSRNPRGLPPRDPRFFVIGSDECRACHRAIHGAWQSGVHARSAEGLSFEQTVDPNCQPCHVPGVEDFEEGVGCESCHGPGSAYADLEVMIDPFKSAAAGLWEPRAMCGYCHNPGHPFHVERDLEAEAENVHRVGR